MQADKNKVEILFSQKENIWHGLTFTDAAIEQIRSIVAGDTSMLGLRLSVKQSGCAGFSYVLDKVIKSYPSDLIYEHDGIRLFVPIKAMPFIDGTELDYVREGLNHIFKFKNPKAQHACGCGESFSI